MTTLELANAEGVLVAVLGSALASDVGTRVPNPRPTSFVRVQRVGGDQLNLVQEQALLLIECWGSTELEAWQLAADAYGVLSGRETVQYNGIELSERRLTSPVNYPDPSTSSPRYQFTLQTTINLEVLP